MIEDLGWEEEFNEGLDSDAVQEDAKEALARFFERHPQDVFFSRQLEVRYERDYFHWITNRAIRELELAGMLLSESRKLRSGGNIKLIWRKGQRYYKREAAKVVQLVNEYSDPNIGAALGLQGEAMILEGFARLEFVMKGRELKRFNDRIWLKTDHDIDFAFEKQGKAYGVEVKNTLGYMDREEFVTKVDLCLELGLRPVIAARMLPKSWINELIGRGGFALIFKYQLYPWAHKELAKRVQRELGLPVDSPRRLEDGTMHRFLKWHETL